MRSCLKSTPGYLQLRVAILTSTLLLYSCFLHCAEGCTPDTGHDENQKIKELDKTFSACCQSIPSFPPDAHYSSMCSYRWIVRDALEIHANPAEISKRSKLINMKFPLFNGSFELKQQSPLKHDYLRCFSRGGMDKSQCCREKHEQGLIDGSVSLPF